MSQITAGVGLISGIDITSLVNKLMAVETQPRTDLANHQTTINSQQTEIASLASQMLSLKASSLALRTSTALSSAQATSSNQNLLTATASNGAALGTYQFNVARLVSTQNLISDGYSSTTAPVFTAGTITVNSAQSRLTDDMRLELLNGQQGVRRGSIRITDRSGASAVIDLSSAVSIGDVVDAINSNKTANVQASTSGGKLVLTDGTGLSGNLVVSEVGGGHTAADLGILQTAGGTTALTGNDIVSVNANTSLAVLNNGMGVRQLSGQNDFHIALRDNTQLDVSLGSAKTLGDVVNAINNATGNGGKLVASLTAKGLTLTDTTSGTTTFAVTAPSGSSAANDLGILSADSNADGVIDGTALLGGLQDVLLSRLNGGSGVSRGTFTITDRQGTTSTVDLTNASTIQDVINAINDPSVTASVTASLNAAGNGIVLTDTSGGAGHLVVANGTSTAATDLKITVDDAVSQVASGDLHRQFVSGATQLTALNGGQGISHGKFQITNSLGASATIDLSTGSPQTLQDVMGLINGTGLGVTATLNSTGDGLLLTDGAGGAGALTVTDTSGTAAADLHIAGSAASGTNFIDGTSRITINVTADDTLTTLAAKLTDSGAMRATLISDGSPISPNRLSIMAKGSGAAGALLIDTGATGLNLGEMVRGQDAVLRVGGSGTQSMVITQSSNTFTNVISHVTLDLTGADPATPVTVTVSTDPSGTASSLNTLVSSLNAVLSKISQDTAYDTTTNTGAILQGDGTVLSAQSRIQSLLFKKFTGTGSNFQTLSSIGFSYKDGQITFDQDKFSAAYQQDPGGVQKLLQDPSNGFLASFGNLMGQLAEAGTGSLSLEAQQLQTQSQMDQTRLDEMDKLLASKRQQLTQSFTNMETALAKMQSQQSALTSLAQLAGLTTSSTSSSSSNSNSSTSSSA